MNGFRADLHCHSTYSDGTFTPDQLIQHAVNKGLQGLSITDHDTVEAYKTAFSLSQKAGLQLIPGVEFSTTHNDDSIHLLAYAFVPTHPSIVGLCAQHAVRRNERNEEILENLAMLHMPISKKELFCIAGENLEERSVGRPHIALAMIKKGYVSSIQEAFKKYLGEGRPAYAKGRIISSRETIEIIHEAKGLAVIAHPHLIENQKTLKDLLQMSFDGIECYYANFQIDTNARWIKLAKKKNWLATGGSDFHGTVKPAIELGASWVNQEIFHILSNHYRTHAIL